MQTKKSQDSMDYKKAGVDINAGNEAVDRIKKMVESTFKYSIYRIITPIGAFCAIVKLPGGLAMGVSTDGDGHKLLSGILLDKHDTLGIDLAAMSFNDLLAHNIQPTFFLDYIAQGKQIPDRTENMIKGMVAACHSSECALIGGEMAELPLLYRPNDYDMAGVAIGLAHIDDIILGDQVGIGMNIYGLPSSGLHANGFTLVLKLFDISLEDSEGSTERLNEYYPELGKTLGEELLIPTKIYTEEVAELTASYDIAGMINVTGGAFIDNPPRIMPDGCAAQIQLGSWPIPPIFNLIQQKGNIDPMEMLRVFNNGIGFMVISRDNITAPNVIPIGKIVTSDSKATQFV